RAYPQMRAYLDLLASPQGRGPTMGAWELIYGRHFNADVLRRGALLAGAEVASRIGRSDDAERFGAAATRDARVASDFVDERTGRFVAYRETADPWFGAISGLDMTVISALLAVRPVTPADADPDAPSRHLTDLAHPAVLATMLALEEAFAPLYQVNRDWRAGGNLGWGLGRFPEDANDGLGSSGGNPWPLTTLWGAQFYYLLAQDVAARAARAGSPPRIGDARQVAFFNRAANEAIIALDAPIPADVWRERLVPALVARADGYLSFVVHHLPDDGGVTEQIDRETGEPRGAADLSWALAELIATIALHEQAHRAT
ncbi:MAG TPA: glycoside hydrolase family 15 protein, partial [Ktedonobacterales bacterium]